MTGWKDWQIGEVVTESDFQNLVQDQVVQRYADASERTATLGTAVAEGMVSYLESTSKVEVYDGSAWVQVGQEGDITSVTAGTGLSGGGTAGDVTLSADYAAIGSAVSITASQVTDITASAAAINTIDDGTQGFTALSNGTAGITYQPVSHNYIINGAFDIWQRGTSFSSVANAAYTADRFQFTRSGTGNTISQQTFSAGELEAASFGGSSYYLRLYTDGTDTAPRIGQSIEDVRTLAGQTVTLSFWAKSDVSDVLQTSSFVLQNFGSGGSAQVGTSFTLPAVTTSWQRYSVSINIPSISGKTIGPNNNLQIQLRPKASTEFTLDIWGVQLEAGSVATPFKRHAPSLQGELAACQRYYQRNASDSATSKRANYGTGAVRTTTTVTSSYSLPVAMRTKPSVSASGGFRVLVALFGGATITYTSADPTEVGGDITWAASGLTAGQSVIAQGDDTLDSVVEYSAEL